MANPHWTKEEDKILLDSIKEHGNTTEGIKVASEKLDRRTEGACGYRYYNVLKKNSRNGGRKKKKSAPRGSTDREVILGMLNFLFTHLSKAERQKFLLEKLESEIN